MQNVKYNLEEIKDKIHACWIGKNIGGTLGGPFEHKHDFLDVKGFTTKQGEPMPNDDLDLQLVWLYALESQGPYNFGARTLAEYWTLAIDPNWNEYGTAKANLFDGIMPPLCGELNNDSWKNSNGAWIRSELWACLTPGYPNIARAFAYADACVDHGVNEGTFAELFTVTLQSLAFFEKDVKILINKALDAIPQESKIAKAVKIVINEYNNSTPYRQVRDILVKEFEDMGWFQAPLNIGFVVIGLLYGEGDFKKSLIYTVNCADDADCTAGTVGATLGIMYGTKAIPNDWKAYVGDEIVTICINAHLRRRIPKTCLELTDRVIDLIPVVLRSKGLSLQWSENHDLPIVKYDFNYKSVQNIPKYSFELPHLLHVKGYGEYDRLPVVKEGEQIKIKLNLSTTSIRANNFSVLVYLPDGWKADYSKSFHLATFGDLYKNTWEATLTVGQTQAINHVIVIAKPSVHAEPVVADFVIKG